MTKSDLPPPQIPPLPAAPARRGRPKKSKAAAAGETRDAIMNAAEDLFSKHGFYGVTIREVAREAGIAPNSFYRQFRDMDELAVALIERAGQSLAPAAVQGELMLRFGANG